eukprot:10511844-Heterocapsa_arctica.AAC.1
MSWKPPSRVLALPPPRIVGPKEWIFGWDPEHNNAWKMNYLVSTREFATSVAVPEGAGAEDAVEDTFADGTTGEIIEFT